MATEKNQGESVHHSSVTTAVRNSGETSRFPIVGIGASAGGLEAFEQFFRNTPADIGMAFVLVPHLAPNHASLLTEILQRSTTMSVSEVQDQMLVRPNTVYIIPPNRDMAIFNGRLQLSVPDEPHAQRLPIDQFLRSLAEDQGENAIGIILSGTGSDGTLGLRAIVGAGGVSLVQEPTSAKYDGMPASAIQAGYAIHVLPVEKMAEVITASARKHGFYQEAPQSPAIVSSMARILMHIRSVTGQDFSLYKKSTIGRRIERRMSQHNIEDSEVYLRYLKENPAETHTLFKELLINVTSFFRDVEAFSLLEQEILPQLFQDRPDGDVFRVWVAGCATGEEAYSIAILLRELMDERHQEFKVQIYSTDLDDDAIAIARAGVYPSNIVQDVTVERLRRFFIKEDADYRIKKEIREMVVFAVHNVIKEPPFTRLDLLSCRNLMIYLEPELQNRLIPVFHYALKPKGVLFLSPSESIGHHTELFSPFNRKWKFYLATHSASSSRTMMTNPLTWTKASSGKAPEEIMKKNKEPNLAELTRRLLIQYFAPASVITDLKGDTIYVHGETGKYLRPAPGQASLNIIEMAREGLEIELRAAIHSASSQNLPTLNREVQVKTNGDFTTVSLSVRPLPGIDGDQNLLLVSFQDIAASHLKSKRKTAAKPVELGRIEVLERELAYSKENLQAIIEEQQASNEELKSTNEELQSTNEELQSTNEELETSKEEMQSVNEELITVNAELQSKIEQLAGMQNDMKNLLDNTNIGTVFLDEHMVIRRFTREAIKIYRLVASDVGRPLADIKSNLEGEDLLAKAQSVLETLVPFEMEVQTQSDEWYLMRIQPYRTLDNVIEGVVLTFTDISKRIEAETAVQLARELAENIVDTVREPLLVLDGDLQVVSANRAFYQYFQVTVADTVGRKIYDLGNSQWDIPSLRELLEIILPRDRAVEGYVVEHDFPTIGHHKIMLNARRIFGVTSEPALILLATKDVDTELSKENMP
ncbi:MAG: chemotaxis protein CheB [Methylophilaceae bacterium]